MKLKHSIYILINNCCLSKKLYDIIVSEKNPSFYMMCPSIGLDSGNYTLSVSGYDETSTGGDSLITTLNDTNINDMMFTTTDVDNDRDISVNCANAKVTGGGWWWNACGRARPTGLYLEGGQRHASGVSWKSAKDTWYSYMKMKYTIIRT